MRRIGIVGVGLLGTAVATRLLEARFEVVGYDVRPQQVKALTTRGLQLAGDLGEAVAGADLVFTILPSLDAVDTVVRGPGGLLEKLPATATIAQMSTISPPLTRALGAAATKRGVGFLDTPMSGTSAMVARGDCTIFVGGDRARADACQPVFDAIARKTLYVGETGLATLAKLATNLLVGLNTAAVAEALVLGAKGGLEPAVLLDILKQSAAGSRMLDVRGPLMVKHDFEAQMKTELFLKDFKLMLEEGMRVGAPLPLTSLTQQLTMATVAAGRGDEDIAAIITTLERLAGMER
jgi:3-hydroxyisobutyrate dehydrogenase-like beta-hydroxyacid dehydrogenase